MLTITLKKRNTVLPDYPFEGFLPWKVNAHISVDYEEKNFSPEEGWIPVVVEASGEELNWMGRNFTGLPRANPVTNPIQKWRGDLAAFIYDHLPRTE